MGSTNSSQRSDGHTVPSDDSYSGPTSTATTYTSLIQSCFKCSKPERSEDRYTSAAHSGEASGSDHHGRSGSCCPERSSDQPRALCCGEHCPQVVKPKSSRNTRCCSHHHRSHHCRCRVSVCSRRISKSRRHRSCDDGNTINGVRGDKKQGSVESDDNQQERGQNISKQCAVVSGNDGIRRQSRCNVNHGDARKCSKHSCCFPQHTSKDSVDGKRKVSDAGKDNVTESKERRRSQSTGRRMTLELAGRQASFTLTTTQETEFGEVPVGIAKVIYVDTLDE